MKKLTAIILTLALLFTSAMADGLDDWDDDYWYWDWGWGWEDESAVASEWAIDTIYTAEKMHIISSIGDFVDYTRNITREELCAMEVRAAEAASDGALDWSGENPFSDTSSMYAAEAAELGLMNGRSESVFDGSSFVTREEAAKIFVTLAERLGVTTENYPQLVLDLDAASPWAADYINRATAYTYLTIDENGYFHPKDNLTVEQAASIVVRIMYSVLKDVDLTFEHDGRLSVKIPVSPAGTGDFVYRGDYKDNDPSLVFTDGPITSKEEADAQMEEITVDVWKLRGNGEKVPGRLTITVHKNIVEQTKAAFADIFNGPEKFPIDTGSTYAYAFRNTAGGRLSEHATGTAIDINPNENYCIYSNGSVVGSLYEPGVNPYSIQKFGDCWTAFVTHGFTWGGDAWSSPKDYMHFSYLGT